MTVFKIEIVLKIENNTKKNQVVRTLKTEYSKPINIQSVIKK